MTEQQLNKLKTRLTPKLRFREFQQGPEWDIVPGDLAFEQIIDKSAPSGLPVLAITQEHGAIPRELIDYHVSVTEQSLTGYKVVEVGDFIISLRSFQGGIEYSNYLGICSPAYIILRSKAPEKASFFRHYFKTEAFIRALNKNLEGIRDGKMVSWKQFSDLYLPIPSSSEQQDIVGCLCSIEELIAVETRKLEALKVHKKGLMQQLFPAEGETTPRLRFKEFQNAGDWDTAEVGDLFTVTRGQVLAMTRVVGEPTTIEPYPVYSSQTKRLGLAGYYSDYLYQDAITWTTDGANAGDVNYREGKFFCTNVCGVLLSKNASANRCIAALINSVAKDHVSYVGNPKLMNNVMAKITIPVPSSEEQHRIAEYLSAIDSLILSQDDIVGSLRIHKEGLMQQLFPSMDEVEA